MIDIRRDLCGWWDKELHVTYTCAEIEGKFGARVYRNGQRPKHLAPLFDSMTLAERVAAFGSVEEADHWMTKLKWNHVEPVANTMKCEKVAK